MDSKVVPFGKHKGKPIEEVIATDPQYLQWLMAQDWFREKFTILYQVVVNHGGEPSETPEHNALQVRFLEDDFCVAFTAAIGLKVKMEKELEKDRIDAVASLNKDIQELEGKRVDEEKTLLQKEAAGRSTYGDDHARAHGEAAFKRYVEDQERWHASSLADSRKAIARCAEKLTTARSVRVVYETPIRSFRYTFARAFERHGIDVALRITASTVPPYAPEPLTTWRDVIIELKPSLGDDYPAILRQIRGLRRYENEHCVLVFNQFTATGATLDQIIRTFDTAGIYVLPFAAITTLEQGSCVGS